MRRDLTRSPLIVVAALLLAGCVPQSPDQDTFRDRSELAIEQTVSAVESTLLVLRLLMREDMLTNYAEIAVHDAQDSLSAASGGYDALNPPRQLDQLYSSTSTLMSDASSAVTDTRIAVSRDDAGDFAKLEKQLSKLAKDLHRKLEEVRAR